MTINVGAQKLENRRPNIILVITDDQGMGDLPWMGNPILKTPHIDSFYEKATRFTDFQVSPTCAPTRSAIMSGRAPFKNGVTHTIFQRERMALEVYTLPQALQSASYKTGLFGKWHLGDEEEYLPQNRGFDEVLMHGAGGIGYTAKSLNRSWKESPLNPVITAAGKEAGGSNHILVSNPTFLKEADGKFRIYYKSMTDKYDKKGYREISLAIRDNIEDPYTNHPNNSLISYAEKGIDIEYSYAFI